MDLFFLEFLLVLAAIIYFMKKQPLLVVSQHRAANPKDSTITTTSSSSSTSSPSKTTPTTPEKKKEEPVVETTAAPVPTPILEVPSPVVETQKSIESKSSPPPEEEKGIETLDEEESEPELEPEQEVPFSSEKETEPISIESKANWVKTTPAPASRRTNLLDKDIPTKSSSNLKVEWGAAELQGKRPTMEDAHISFCDDDGTLPERGSAIGIHGLWGIFDGHKGPRASLFVAEHLHHEIFTELENSSQTIPHSITRSFIVTDEKLVAEEVANSYSDGSTAVVALIHRSLEEQEADEEKLFVANIGDAEALLVKSEEQSPPFVLTTVRHKPNVPSELARIKAAGGFVFGGRLSGLSVSRSFGDKELKLSTHSEEDGIEIGKLMSEEPYIHSSVLKKGEDLALIMGCDGVWEKNFSHEESVAFVRNQIKEGKSAKEISEALVNEALSRGSSDNISAITLLFHWN